MNAALLTERQALNVAIDAATADRPLFSNYTPARNGKSSAICYCCGKQSRPARVDHDGEPDLWRMGRGWSTAPMPASYVHADGSKGSTFTCPSCNKRLNAGETLPVRSGAFMRKSLQ